MNGMSNMAAMGKIGAGFATYGRYPTLGGYGGGYSSAAGGAGGAGSAYSLGVLNNGASYADAVQTVTPPQTPPNLKVNSSMAPASGLLAHPYASPSNLHRSSVAAAAAAAASVAAGAQAAASAASDPCGDMLIISPSMATSSNVTDPSSTAFRPVYRT